jgi:hypothetical protein
VAFALLDEDWGTSEGDSRDEADSCCGDQEEAGSSSSSSGESDNAEELR